MIQLNLNFQAIQNSFSNLIKIDWISHFELI